MERDKRSEYVERVISGDLIHPIQIELDKLQFYFSKIVECAKSEQSGIEVVSEFIYTLSSLCVNMTSVFIKSMTNDPLIRELMMSSFVRAVEKDLEARIRKGGDVDGN